MKRKERRLFPGYQVELALCPAEDAATRWRRAYALLLRAAARAPGDPAQESSAGSPADPLPDAPPPGPGGADSSPAETP